MEAVGQSSEVSTASAMEELQAEFDAFRESSTQLDIELEDELCRMERRAMSSEEELRKVRVEIKEATVRLTKELLGCQRELAKARKERCAAIRMVRDREEALEQAAENERRVMAEVESLREALDDSMELAAFAQTELEDSKMSAEEQRKKFYQDLEETHAELALLTPGKGEGTISIGSRDRGSSSGRRIRELEVERMLTRRFFSMRSFEENSEHGITPASNPVESVSPTAYPRLVATSDDAPDSGIGREGVSFSGVEAYDAEQTPVVGELGEDLMRQLRLCRASPSTNDVTIPRVKKGRESILTNSTCYSSQTPGSGRPRSSLDCLSIHNAPEAILASSMSGNTAPLRTGRETRLVSLRAEEDVVILRGSDDDILHGDHDRSAYDNDTIENEDDGDGSARATKPDPCRVLFGGGEEAMRALSGWRPFAWCEPRQL